MQFEDGENIRVQFGDVQDVVDGHSVFFSGVDDDAPRVMGRDENPPFSHLDTPGCARLEIFGEVGVFDDVLGGAAVHHEGDPLFMRRVRKSFVVIVSIRRINVHVVCIRTDHSRR